MPVTRSSNSRVQWREALGRKVYDLSRVGEWPRALSVLELAERYRLQPDVATYSSAMKVFGWSQALHVFESMSERDLMAYGAILGKLLWPRALRFWEEMQSLKPNVVSFGALAGALGEQ